MHQGILAERRAKALQKIEEKSGIDLSRSALHKAPNVEIFQLFQLEKLAEELEPSEIDLSELLGKIQNIKGVGPSLFEKIKSELTDSV